VKPPSTAAKSPVIRYVFPAARSFQAETERVIVIPGLQLGIVTCAPHSIILNFPCPEVKLVSSAFIWFLATVVAEDEFEDELDEELLELEDELEETELELDDDEELDDDLEDELVITIVASEEEDEDELDEEDEFEPLNVWLIRNTAPTIKAIASIATMMLAVLFDFS